ncbi:MAG: hypothetical protein IAI50_20065 [Candidatus Eremiobacteraeota bacterium]|nr:hypothetical protein [Candidatus Eremiobacteraeota bacterium]
MILSIHVPKAAGNSFRELLKAKYGDRMMGDYGDWAGFDFPEANERRAARTKEMRQRGPELLEKYDLIHGHFQADKYLGLFPETKYLAFFRDPYQQAVAHYYFLLRNPQRDHPEERIFHENKMTLQDYLRWDAFKNHTSQYMGSIPIEEFSMVGMSAEFPRSLALFRSVFDTDLGEQTFANVNEERKGTDYEIDDETRKAVDKNRPADIELYRRAKEIFERQTSRAGI